MEVFFIMEKTINKKYKYGSVIHLKGNRLCPWVARLTLGYNVNGYPVYHFLGSFEEEIDAHLALRDYNNNPYELFVTAKQYNSIIQFSKIPSKLTIKSKKEIIDKTNYTFKQVWEGFEKTYIPNKEQRKRMREEHIKIKGKLGLSNSMGLIAASKKFELLWNERYSSLKKDDFQDIIFATEGKKTKIVDMRNLICKLDNYALEADIINKGYGQLLDVEYEDPDTERVPFTYGEINTLWELEGNLIVDILLILLYTGMRIEELLFMKIENIHLASNYIVGGLKTKNGINRIIPIHSLIKHIVLRYYNENNRFLFTLENGKRLTYHKYRKQFKELMENLGFNHTTHETRHTVESEFNRLMDLKNANKKCVDLIIGHSNGNTGERVYTKKSIEELIATIELLDYNKKTVTTYIKVCS